MVHIIDHETNTLASLLDYKPLSPIPTTESLSPPTTEEDEEEDDALKIPKKRKLSPTQNNDLFSLPVNPISINSDSVLHSNYQKDQSRIKRSRDQLYEESMDYEQYVCQEKSIDYQESKDVQVSRDYKPSKASQKTNVQQSNDQQEQLNHVQEQLKEISLANNEQLKEISLTNNEHSKDCQEQSKDQQVNLKELMDQPLKNEKPKVQERLNEDLKKIEKPKQCQVEDAKGNNELNTKPAPTFGPCTSCKAVVTPQWRRGPHGYKTLCNACGLKWCKENQLKGITSPPKGRNPSKKTAHLLFYRKQFITHGLYSAENREQVKKPQAFEFPLPIHQDHQQLEKEFELPPYIWQERELKLIKCLKDKKPVFTKIRANIFVERRPKLYSDQRSVCQCKAPTGDNEIGCGDDCINRMLFYECDTKYCPCGSKCSNQRIQKKASNYKLQVFKTDERGWGLRTNQDIKKGAFIIEYRGEIISQKLCEERMCTDYVNESNFYFLEYSKGEVIDACTKGTEARFINHSCVPNCHIEKWSYRGEAHFCVFASKDIPANTELSYDYNFSTFNVENEQLCHCGSEGCRGTIGKKIKSQIGRAHV